MPLSTLSSVAQIAPGGAAIPKAATNANGAEDPALREAARRFEQVFIAQMLKQAKLGENNSSFSGGYGEDAFRSFMVDEYAAALTKAESFGLADQIYAQLKQKADADAE